MFEAWGTRGDLSLEEKDRKREWKLRHLEIPFLRYPQRDEACQSILRIPDNQEAIQKMVAKNPLFQEGKWRDKWLDFKDPERVRERLRKQEADSREVLARMETWQIEAQRQYNDDQNRKRPGAYVLRGRQLLAPDGRVLGNPPDYNPGYPFTTRPVQDLGQWMREIEEDERRRHETPTEQRTRERREQIEENRHYLLRDGRFAGIVEDGRRLPNGPERQEVFRRFSANL
jgi:hypothetical protein